MTDREKLIELIIVASQEITVSELRTHIAEYLIADYLIARGVVIREKGEWIEKKHNDGYGEYSLFHCSKCDAPTAQKTRNFCSNCGADMRGEQNE